MGNSVIFHRAFPKNRTKALTQSEPSNSAVCSVSLQCPVKVCLPWVCIHGDVVGTDQHIGESGPLLEPVLSGRALL